MGALEPIHCTSAASDNIAESRGNACCPSTWLGMEFLIGPLTHSSSLPTPCLAGGTVLKAAQSSSPPLQTRFI